MPLIPAAFAGRLPRAGPVRAVALMFLATIAFSSMHVLVRDASESLHPFQIAFFRNLFGLIVVGPWLFRYGFGILRTARPGLHVLRALLNVLAMMCFFYALSITPLSQVAALSFTAPIFATILAVILLGERVGRWRWSAILFGFAGTLVAVRPGFAEVGLGTALVLVQAVAWAGALVVIRVVGRADSAITIASYMVLLMIPLSLGPALWVWRTPGGEQLPALAALGVIGTAAQLLMTQALKEGETGVVMPVDFCRLVWASALGYWFFAEVPSLFTILGGAMIFLSTTCIAWRENRLRRASCASAARPAQ